MSDHKSLSRRVGVAVGGQLCHALYQVALVVAAPAGLYPVLAGGGIVVALFAATRSIDAIEAEFTRIDRERAQRRSEQSSLARRHDELVTELEQTESALASAREELTELRSGSDGRSIAPVVTPDGGVKTADDVSMEELDDYILECCETLDAAGEGDLSQRMDDDTPSEALNKLVVEYNEMADALEQTIETASDFSGDVTDSSEQVTAATEAVKDASESVAGTVQEIADVFHEQHQQISGISDEMSDMSATIEEIAASADQVNEMAEKTERRTVEGIEAGREAKDTMELTVEQTETVVNTVETLDDQMDEIGQIVDMIDDIAEQTNILALNASIEAAHASSGDNSSDGFTVVADEVKSLAEETKDATNQIENLIEDVQEQTTDSVDEIREMQESVEDGQEAVGEGLEALESIMEHVQETTSGVREIAGATDDQATTSEEVASIADQAAETSRENMEEAEQVAAIAEEQNLALGEMYVNVKMLTMRARQLTALFERYDSDE